MSRYVVITLRGMEDETYTDYRKAFEAAQDDVRRFGSGRVVAQVEAVLMPGETITLNDEQTEEMFTNAEARRPAERQMTCDLTSERSR